VQRPHAGTLRRRSAALLHDLQHPREHWRVRSRRHVPFQLQFVMRPLEHGRPVDGLLQTCILQPCLQSLPQLVNGRPRPLDQVLADVPAILLHGPRLLRRPPTSHAKATWATQVLDPWRDNDFPTAMLTKRNFANMTGALHVFKVSVTKCTGNGRKAWQLCKWILRQRVWPAHTQ